MNETSTSGTKRRQRTLAETQTAGFGFANGKVVQVLVLEFHDNEPAITVRHDRVDHPDPTDDREPRTTNVETAMVRPTGDRVNRKVEIGTRHGCDRVLVETHDHAPRAYVRHEQKDEGWTEQAAWELHPATGIAQVGGESVADGGTDTSDTERGLYEKYEVLRDGKPLEGTFVLRPETDEAAREAILAYADATDNEELAEDLRLWINRYLITGGDRDV